MDPRAELVGQINATLKQAEDLQNEYKSKELPQEVANQIKDLLDEVEGLQDRLTQHDRVSEAKNYMSQSRGVAAMTGAFSPETSPEEPASDAKAFRTLEFKNAAGDIITMPYNVPLAVQQPGYKSAFESYLRHGKDMLGPNDRKALTAGTDTQGGYLVPEEMVMQVLKKIATTVVFRQYGRVYNTSTNLVKFPKVNYTTDDKYTSGVRSYWLGEVPSSSTAHQVTDPVFGELNIPIHNHFASTKVTNDLLEDSAFDVEGMLAMLFGEAFALGENDVFWNGTGAGQPLGLLANVDGTDGVASIVSGSGTTLTNDGLLDLVYGLPAQYENGARLFMRKATELVIRKLLNAGSTEYAWVVGNQVGQFGPVDPMLLGYPLSRDEFVPAIAGNAYPIVFGQLSGYIIVDRVGLSIQRLDEVDAATNQRKYIARKRVGGSIAEPWRLRVQKIST